MNLTYQQKKSLTEKVYNLEQSDLLEIAQMIEADTDDYLRKANQHIYVNLSSLSPDALLKIHTFISSKYEKYVNSNIHLKFNKLDLYQKISENTENTNLSNYEKSILKKSKYISNQKEFKLKNQQYKQSLKN